ncbi:MAG: endo-1,4-beta-xylanase [Niabella sp.]
MKNRMLFSFIVICVLAANTAAAQKRAAFKIPSLKEIFKTDFLVGTALSEKQINGKDPVADKLVSRQFNIVTAEDAMKSEVTQPGWNQFNFTIADKLVAWAQKNNIKVHGHTLIWHSQLPAYMKNMQDADSVKQFFENQIKTVAGRYGKKIVSWDVVNEALNEDGSLRKSVFLEKLGAGYIAEAFRLAALATPESFLYYNDYNIELPDKRAGCISIIKQIQQAGIRIDGVGIQGHWHLGKVPFKDIEESIEQYAALGIKVAITELDINVLPTKVSGADVSRHFKGDAASNPYVNGLPDSVQNELASDYAQLFKIFLKHKNNISRITFWGVHDGQSWLNGWPVAGRTNYPLLFDRQGKPKPAFYSVIATKNYK